MSWDVSLYALASDPAEFPHEFEKRSLGDARFVKARIRRSLPDLKWNGAGAVLVRERGVVSITVRGGSAEAATGPVDSICLSFRGDADVLEVIRPLCKENGWVACDESSLTLLDLDDPNPRTWSQFRDEVKSVQDCHTAREQAASRPRSPFRWWKGLFRFAGEPRLNSEMVFEGLPMGDAQAVRHYIGTAFPGIEWTAKKGKVVIAECAFEFLVPAEGAIRQVDFYVKCGGTDDYRAEAAPHIEHLLQQTGWTVIDWN